LDALVRRDLAAPAAGNAGNAPSPFSQRLTADERNNAGFSWFTPDQVTRLDGFVARYRAAGSARTLLAPPVYAARSPAAERRNARRHRPTAGCFRGSCEWGSGGASAGP